MCGIGTRLQQPAVDEAAVDALNKIWKICHKPSKGRHAYTHFMADFDEIRALCKPFLDDAV